MAVRDPSCILLNRTNRYSVPTEAHQCILDTAAARKIADIVLFHQLPRERDWNMKNTANAAVLAVTEMIAAPTMYCIL